MKDSKTLRAFHAGQPIRFEPEEKGRFKPLSVENWRRAFYASPVDFGGGVPGSQPQQVGVPDTQPDAH